MMEDNQVFSGYPRPQLRRNSFISLNGTWDFAQGQCKALPEIYTEKLIVPYPPQSKYSGIARNIDDRSYLFYRRRFTLPQGFTRSRVMLHIGAADQVSDVYLNNEHILSHKGGYTSFSADLTNWLKEENELIIRTYDDLGDKSFPYGKQKQKRGGMWYTPVSGIWQSVWLESVPERYVKSIEIRTSGDEVTITAEGCQTNDTLCVFTPEGTVYGDFIGNSVKIKIPNPVLWSPERPYLYNFEITANEDKVTSYFAFRTLEVKKVNGISRLCLNGEPYFFNGVLDQGYWPEGIYTPPTQESFAKDILEMKALGFNTLRKHIKVEHELFYYECDRLGMIVFQDMVNNGGYSFIKDTALPTVGLKRKSDKRSNRNATVRKTFLESMKATVAQLKNHPCICMWTIFNEGWGQFDADKCTDYLRELDSTRFIDSTSGWFKQKNSDVESIHTYFKKFKTPKAAKPIILSEFGGYAFSVEGHLFSPGKEYGYRSFSNGQQFESALAALYKEQIVPAVNKGLCASILTQLSDVEDETNGLLTYDRAVLKVSKEPFLKIAAELAEQIKK